MFNKENTEWKDGSYSLFLGQEPALNDTINKPFQAIFDLYKLQKSIDWDENEVSLEQDRLDMLTAPTEAREMMVENLAYQWRADSVAARSIAGLFAPFVTNSELWDAWVKITEIENTHALTYSEIVRQCIPDVQEVFNRIMQNEQMEQRMSTINEAFAELDVAGAKYKLGMISKDEAYPIVMRAVVALYCLERGQFVVTFANTFGVVEATQMFQGIGQLVAKIAQDERWVHARVGEEVLKAEFATERGAMWLVQNQDTIKKMVDEVRENEYAFNHYLASKGWQVNGCNEKLMNQWVDFNFADIYKALYLPVPFEVGTKFPLKYMEHWLNLDKFQVANQEQNSVNYVLNSVVNDVPDNYVFD